ncbi:hypothetical protein [Microbacterium sp. MTN4-26]|uniref:hypothetical protein n=1 Tax=unclassified Microbacterium TaxID=2609290 RepID=UPI0036F286BD
MDVLTLRSEAGLTRDVRVVPYRAGGFCMWLDEAQQVEMYPAEWRRLGWEPWAYATTAEVA